MKKFIVSGIILAILAASWAEAASAKSAKQECDCSYQKCIDISEQETSTGRVNFPEIKLTGISGIKNSEHPTRGEFSSIVLFLNEAVCFHGAIFTPGDGPQPQPYVLPNTTHIQLILKEGQIEKFSRDHKGKQFTVRGRIIFGISAWHTTPLLLDVTDLQSAR